MKRILEKYVEGSQIISQRASCESKMLSYRITVNELHNHKMSSALQNLPDVICKTSTRHKLSPLFNMIHGSLGKKKEATTISLFLLSTLCASLHQGFPPPFVHLLPFHLSTLAQDASGLHLSSHLKGLGTDWAFVRKLITDQRLTRKNCRTALNAFSPARFGTHSGHCL
ncbi:hypothetical protein CEXT_23841 [Caerostris extrusa]|uniref:Uncharacterized protein n=1 Tax=Caerostris extrusa TaxID=172846 RepID=A0AAV4PR14_CAEEX|nr:hypothetical protein CEXT_23841 [Caerostris extrusa]